MPDFYGTEADFTAYMNDRNRAVPSGNIPASLLVASEWIDRVYGSRFSGIKTAGRAQVRQWPRVGAFESIDLTVIPSNQIPTEIEHATYEAVTRVLQGVSLSVDYTPGKYKSVSIAGAVSVEYAGFASAQDMQTQYVTIDQLLMPLLNRQGLGGDFSSYSGKIERV